MTLRTYNGFTSEQRLRAFAWLKSEIAAGRRTQPTSCEACGQTRGVIAGHSEDYSEPFGPHIGRFALCYLCHMILHARYSRPRAFRAYVAALKAGRKFPPASNWYAVQGMLNALESGGATPTSLWENAPLSVDLSLLERMAAGEFRPAP